MSKGYGKVNTDGTLSSAGKPKPGYVSLSQFETDDNGKFFEFYDENAIIVNDKEFFVKSTVLTDNDTFEKDYAQWKRNREYFVSIIEVEYNGKIYQGDIQSQTLLSNAINGLPDETSVIPWTAKDNSIAQLDIEALKAILLDAGTQTSILWNKDRPTK